MHESATPASPQQMSQGKTWRVGTLVYDRRGLFNVFFWMLWGDFVLNLMDSGVAANIATIQLSKYHASKTLIGFINGTFVEILCVLMVPIISTMSDRHRGWLGRRMPYMLWSAAPSALVLALTGFSPQISGWLAAHAATLLRLMSAGALTITVFTIFFLCWRFWDMFPQSLYYYLWTDVIPHDVMGTFVSLCKVVATAGSLLFNWFLFQHLKDRPQVICLLAAGAYLVVFVIMCFAVREGNYPPPEPPPPGKPLKRAARSVKRFVYECYSLGFYWKYYLYVLCFMCGFRPFRDFLLLYGTETLHMPQKSYGNLMAVRDGVQIGVFFLIGPIIDRFHPIRAGLFGFVLMAVTAGCSALFISGQRSFVLWFMLTFVAVAVFQGATGALGPRILPKEKYGQFCSAAATVWHVGLMVLTPTLGYLLDKFGNGVSFVWFFAFSAAGIVMLSLVYRDWKKLGGDEGYRPPVVLDEVRSGSEVVMGERV